MRWRVSRDRIDRAAGGLDARPPGRITARCGSRCHRHIVGEDVVALMRLAFLWSLPMQRNRWRGVCQRIANDRNHPNPTCRSSVATVDRFLPLFQTKAVAQEGLPKKQEAEWKSDIAAMTTNSVVKRT